MYMDTQNQEPLVGASQEVEAARTELEAATKQIKSAVGVTAFIAAANVLLGAILTFLPDVFADTFDPSMSLFYIGFGSAYLLLSIGLSFHSRICALIALVVFAADAILMFVWGGFEAASIGSYVMRGALLLGILGGLIYTFKYHAIVRKHEATVNAQVSDLIQENKPRLPVARIVVFSIIACAGIAAAIYGFSTGAFASGRNFDDWTEFSSGAVTMRVPASRIEEESETDPTLPGVTFLSASSESRAVAVLLITYQNINPLMQGAGLSSAEVERLFVESLVDEGGFRISNWSEGTMQGVRYQQAQGMYDGHPFAYRAFSSGDDIYIAAIILRSENDENLIDNFFDSIVIR